MNAPARIVRSSLLVAFVCSLYGCPATGVEGTYRTCLSEEGEAAWQRASAALANMDYRAALEDLRAAVVLCPDLIPAHVAYQDAAMRVGGDVERSMKTYYVDLAGEGLPSPVPAYMLARLDETAYAQSNALDKILAEHPGFAWGFLSRGRVNRSQGRLVEALRNFKQALSRDSELHGARLELAQVLADLGRNEEAAVEYKAYLASKPNDREADREYITLLLYRLSRVDEAYARILALEAKGDQSLDLRMDRAATMWRARRYQDAVRIYLDILREDPNRARAALNIGLLYYEVVVSDDASRRKFWPGARASFRYFLARSEPSDGHENYERTFGVPYRLRRIEELLGPTSAAEPTLDAMVWPAG